MVAKMLNIRGILEHATIIGMQWDKVNNNTAPKMAANGLISFGMKIGKNATTKEQMITKTADIRAMKRKSEWNSIGILKHAWHKKNHVRNEEIFGDQMSGILGASGEETKKAT